MRFADRVVDRHKLLVDAAGVSLVACAGLIFYPDLLSLSSHPLETKSDSLDVRGDTSVAILAFTKCGQGKKIMMGYFLITDRAGR